MNLPNNPDLILFLKNLFDTNENFVNTHDEKFFAKIQDEQNPKLTILKCSDSRVQMEYFDKTPQNNVFAIRNIGNQISTSEGSVDFGVEILNTRFLLIIGHSGCGAVMAAFNGVSTSSDAINKELSTIRITSHSINEAIVQNVNHQVDKALMKYRPRIELGTLTILGAIYDFKNDFGFGFGKVVLTNINGITSADAVRDEYLQHVDNLHFLEPVL